MTTSRKQHCNHHGVFLCRAWLSRHTCNVVQEGKRKAASVPRALLLAGKNANQTATNRVPMVTTYHPKNTPVCKILSRNYNILTNDDSTRVIFPQPPLEAYRWAQNLRDLLVHSDFPLDQPAQPGTFPCKRTINLNSITRRTH